MPAEPPGAFRAMNTDITIQGVGISTEESARATRDARDHAARWEQLFSRFRPESLLSQLNRDGVVHHAPSVFLDLIDKARMAVTRTAGLFNPAMLPELVALGYDRSFELLTTADAVPGTVVTQPWDNVVIDRSTGTVRLPDGLQVDLGGIGKGAWVDIMANRLAGWPGGCVNAGGDIAVWGESPDGAGWCVGVESPADPDRDVALLVVPNGAPAGIATSGTNRRTWNGPEGRRHHIIDPRTGRPSQSRWVTVTVVGPTATEADLAAKAILISGNVTPVSLLDCRIAITIDHEGRVSQHDRNNHEPLIFIA